LAGIKSKNRAPGLPDTPRFGLRGQASRSPNKKYAVDLKGTAFVLLPEGRGSWLADDGCAAAPNQTPRRVKPTAFSGFTTAARRIVGKRNAARPTPTGFGQNQKQKPRSRFA
jgi:hypothetical protein